MTAKAELAGRLLDIAGSFSGAGWMDDALTLREAAAALTEAGAGEAKPVAYADLDALAEMRRKHQPKEGRTAVSMVYPDAHDGFGKTRAALYASPPPVQPVVMARETMWGEVVKDDSDATVFMLCEEDNRDGHHFLGHVTLAADTFPIGTKISIREPQQESSQ